jgi:hypothetical protein
VLARRYVESFMMKLWIGELVFTTMVLKERIEPVDE